MNDVKFQAVLFLNFTWSPPVDPLTPDQFSLAPNPTWSLDLISCKPHYRDLLLI